jgi:sulfatase modifying factor 1
MSGTECGGEDCCLAIPVTGGSFLLGRGSETCDGCTDGCPTSGCDADEQPEHPATVDDFLLDKFEATVGRFRRFVDAYADGWRPGIGKGAHPGEPASGWQSSWLGILPDDAKTLEQDLACGANATWTHEVKSAEAETYPITCTTWYEAQSFCIWDRGRLALEVEWEYAAAGGDENRLYPWGSAPPDELNANWSGSSATALVPVGSYQGSGSYNARFGHADMAGSLFEWVFDQYQEEYYTETESGCNDCVSLQGTYRGLRGGSYMYDGDYLRAAYRGLGHPATRNDNRGIRCAHDP